MYNFWLSNLSSPPEGSTLVAIPTTQLGDCLFKPSGPTLRMSILLVITGTALRYISQSRTVPDATHPLRTNLSSRVNLVEQSLSHTGITYTSVTYALTEASNLQSGDTQPLPLPTSALIRFAPTPVPTITFLPVLHRFPRLPIQLARKG